MSEAEQVIPTDPMDLSSEEYERSISDLMGAVPDVVEDVVVKDVEQETELEPDIVEDIVEDVEQDAEELFEIVYKGEVQKLPRDKVIELAQKGFSYHSDMNRIAPHKKLVTLIEGDEEISTLVNNYVSERAKPKTSKLDDFDTEEAWLEDNLKRQKAAEKFSQVKSTPPGQEIIEFFRDKDPENYEKVLGALGDHANQLTVEDYQKVNGSMDELEKFYDDVKSKVVAGIPAKPKQTFRTRSGGGAPPRQVKSKQKAWEMSSKDFNQMIQKVKGY